MRLAVLVLVAACGSSQAPSPAAPVAGADRPAHTCSDAAVGLERATKGVRAPESTVFQPMRDRCVEDAWPAPVVECFATMREGEVGRCAGMLSDTASEAFFGVLAGGDSDRASIASARVRLGSLVVGIEECDRFVRMVANVLTCERMALRTRAQLGTETADFWDLPTSGLSGEAQRRMAAACGASLASLQQQAVGAGCMP